jgi:hypothetical protein
MTRFLHWRKTTWALPVWSAAMVTWLLVGGPGAILLGLFWLSGAAAVGATWFTTRPPYRRGRGFRNGLFAWPGPGHWRVVNLHRTFEAGSASSRQ